MSCSRRLFQWAPTLGGECYCVGCDGTRRYDGTRFQRAPTLGGECYQDPVETLRELLTDAFQWAPTLGGECYLKQDPCLYYESQAFQWAPTLGGECYIEALLKKRYKAVAVSMGTHPWG